jgi:membrane protein YqaA with SNARE-associated domain
MGAMPRDSQAETRARLLSECRALFDRWERIASGRAATGIMFVWAVAEATVWPVIPDFLLVLIAAGNRRRFYVPLAAAVLGSAVGGSAIFLLAYRTLRLADGPGEVHKILIAKNVLKRYHDGQGWGWDFGS